MVLMCCDFSNCWKLRLLVPRLRARRVDELCAGRAGGCEFPLYASTPPPPPPSSSVPRPHSLLTREKDTDYCTPLKNWRQMYAYDPLASIPPNQTHLVLGGEASLWSEQTDGVSVDGVLWPRLSAVGEVLWVCFVTFPFVLLLVFFVGVVGCVVSCCGVCVVRFVLQGIC